MSDITFVIPYADYHKQVVARAISSVNAQTVPCEVIAIPDPAKRGAGWARNKGLLQATTPYVVFLDADDTVDPLFAEVCLKHIQQNHYVYTDWYEDDRIVLAKPEAIIWTDKTYHVVTCLLAREDAILVGGFNEQLRGAEDTDFYVRLRLSGVQPIHIPQPLFSYTKDGQRSHEFMASPEYPRTMTYFDQRYKGLSFRAPLQPVIYGEQRSGDVIAECLWAGNRAQVGLSTGRQYERCGNGKRLWVNPIDVKLCPHLWREVSGIPLRPVVLPDSPTIITHKETVQVQASEPVQTNGVQAFAQWLFPTRPTPKTVVYEDGFTALPYVPQVPNITRVLALAREGFLWES